MNASWTELDRMGAGSIVRGEGSDLLFRKNSRGRWVPLAESLVPLPLPDEGVVVQFEVKVPALAKFVAGDVIVYDGWIVATKGYYGTWMIAGNDEQPTSDELEREILDLDSVRKVGSIAEAQS